MSDVMQRIIDRERKEADFKARMEIAQNMWLEGEYNKDEILRVTDLSIEQISELQESSGSTISPWFCIGSKSFETRCRTEQNQK